PPSIQVADNDREALAFDAGEAVTLASAILRDLTAGTDIGSTSSSWVSLLNPPLESVTLAGNIATVTVSGLTRGSTYEVGLTFTSAAGLRWTRTLIVECVG
ncbi:MAG: hypothetical protein M3440_13610, partial [Chloroflexota bacterium]|nr:hypothetical protein [Chloroflexota bacterium]